jgi:hypothetical protein
LDRGLKNNDDAEALSVSIAKILEDDELAYRMNCNLLKKILNNSIISMV